MTFDPTQNRIPVCLLTPEELEALKKWPHGHEFRSGWWGTDGEWLPNDRTLWDHEAVYRGKPAPVVESKWFNLYPWEQLFAHESRKMADAAAADRIGVLRIDTIDGVSTCHLEDL